MENNKKYNVVRAAINEVKRGALINLGFDLSYYQSKHQEKLFLPSYYNKEHDLLLMQYDPNTFEDLELEDLWFCYRKNKGYRAYIKVTDEFLIGTDKDIIINELIEVL